LNLTACKPGVRSIQRRLCLGNLRESPHPL
jgi:hypothetical protein